MIQKAAPTDIDRLKKITEACADHLISQGIFQWNKNYPSRAVFEADVTKETVYVYRKDNQIVGCVVFSYEKDHFYNKVNWLSEEDRHLYVHRLAVHPDCQGKGIARSLMDFGEAMAQENKCRSIRLDTFSKNPRNNTFYQARGYQHVGEVFFSQKSPYPFYCYEKLLD